MLAALLWITFAVTFFLWCVPMLFLPRTVLLRMHIPVKESILFVRLLGAAVLGLCVLYLFGAARAHQGRNVIDVLVVAMTNNAMAAAILWRYALQDHYLDWPRSSRIYVHASGGVVTVLALALLVFGLWHG